MSLSTSAPYFNIIDNHIQKLNQLLSNEAFKYSHQPPSEIDSLINAAGIYHFFEIAGDQINSLYVGKAGFGAGKWRLGKRIRQHYQPSQKYTLLGKTAKATSISSSEVKIQYIKKKVFLQWLIVPLKREEAMSDFEIRLKRIESFIISILSPKYSD